MNNFVVVLDNIRSVLNVGSIIRTAEGVGVETIFFCGITPGLENSKIKKTSLNAEKYINFENAKSSLELILKLKKKGYAIISIEQTVRSQRIDQAKVPGNKPLAFVFGNEISGVDLKVLDESDMILEIPMFGKKNSLNVSTCVGIVLYFFTLK